MIRSVLLLRGGDLSIPLFVALIIVLGCSYIYVLVRDYDVVHDLVKGQYIGGTWFGRPDTCMGRTGNRVPSPCTGKGLCQTEQF